MSSTKGASSTAIVAVVVAVIAIIGAGAYAVTLQPQTQIQTQIQTQTQTQTQTQIQTNTVTVTQTPLPPPVKELKTVKFHLAWIVSESDAGYLTAIEKGFYKDEGLRVEFTPSTQAGIQMRLVAAGEYHIGLATAPEVITTRAAGPKVIALTMMYQNFPSGFYSLPGNPVKAPKDLEGKKLGIIPVVTEYILYRDVMTRAGVDLTKVQEVTVSFDVISPLVTGQVDVTRGWANDQFSFAQKGYPNVVFWHWGKDSPAYASGIFTTEEYLRNNEDTVAKFVRASMKGWYYAVKHRGEAVDFIVKHNPQVDRVALTAKLNIILDQFVITDTTAQKGLGWMDGARWAATQKILLDSGAIKASMDPSALFTNKYLPGIVQVD
jgi:ABC-type nitrate/sulfonate/bicarbonate transport system substrate-binding protein